MTDTTSNATKYLTFVVFTADVWEHVCPTVRITGPAEMAGVNVIRGSEWLDGELKIYPERVSEGNLVIIQRNFPENIEAYEEIFTQARNLGKPVVYELDDLIPELPDEHPDFYHYITSRSAIVRAVTEADAVIGSTPTLCDNLRPFNSNIFTIPNYLNDRLWSLVPPPKNDTFPVTIGYLGGHSHSYDLNIVAPVLENLLNQYGDDITIKFWGIAPPEMISGYPNAEWVDVGLVSYKDFAAYFVGQTCDLFIAPLVDNEFNRSKSWLKYLEYSAIGIPGIYSRVTPYERIVSHGETGFLATTHEEWKEFLEQLINDPELRHQLGLRAQEHVKSDWLLSENINKWIATYRDILSNPRINEKSTIDNIGVGKLLTWQSELEIRAHALHHQYNDIKAQLNQEKLLLTNEIETVKQQLDETQQQLNESQKRLDVSHQQLDETRQQLGEFRQQLTAYEKSLLKSENQRALLQDEFADKSHELTKMHNTAVHFHQMYLEIYNSRSWKLMQKFQVIRLKLIPKNGRIENTFRLLKRSIAVLRQEGLNAFITAVKRKLRGQIDFQPADQQIVSNDQPELSISVSDGKLIDFPAISIIQVQPNPLSLEEDLVNDWIQSQTLSNAAILVIWDKQAKQAWYSDDPNNNWKADNTHTLLSAIDTKYVCIASPDLLKQTQTYLESNLIALETQELAFTVNFRGNQEWFSKKIHQGMLPGNENSPLLRQIVRKDCLHGEFQLDLSPWLQQRDGNPSVAGKIILHTTNDMDRIGSMPFTSSVGEWEFIVINHNILARSKSDSNWRAARLNLHPVGTVLPSFPLSLDIPHAIMIHPFLAVGGAEQIHLKVIQKLVHQLSFAIVTYEPHNPELGTSADSYREVTPLVYTLPDFIEPPLYWSFLAYLIMRINPQCLYIANGTPWIYDSIGEIKRKYPHIRTVDQVYDSEVGWINRYDENIATHVDAHIGVNSKICQAYIKKGTNPEETYLLENGIEPDELNPSDYSPDLIFELKNKFDLPINNKVVTFVSRIHQQKRPMDFVELARRFSKYPTITFFMVGDGPLAELVDSQIMKIGLSNIKRLSFYRPISDILAVTDVLVLPSDFEGMPMIIIEAQAMGKPVVVTDVGNNQEIIDRTQGGIVTKIGDIGALMTGIFEMLENPPNSQELRMNTLNYFDISKVAQRYYDVLLGAKDA
jgi:glycosyltransferase involved in cell wall biosynthesis